MDNEKKTKEEAIELKIDQALDELEYTPKKFDSIKS